MTLPLELCLEWIGGSVDAIIPTGRKWKGEGRREEKREKKGVDPKHGSTLAHS